MNSTKENKNSLKKRTLIAFPDMQDPYYYAIDQSQRHGPLTFLLNHYQYDYIVLFLFSHLAPNKEDLLAYMKKSKQKAEILWIDCFDFSGTKSTEMLEFLRTKLAQIQLNIHEQDVDVCLGGAFAFLVLHTAVMKLRTSGELPCRLIQVRPERTIFSSLSHFEEIDFACLDNDVSQKEKHSAEHIKLASKLGIVGTHTLKNTLDACAFLAPTPFPVLILGETGTGKGLLAKYIHALSGRPENAFVEVNCAAIPENLVESVLFGHKKGSFTGAVTDMVGKFVQANGGTLFLDEIGDMPLAAQAKILKVLEDGLIDILGSDTPTKVDVKIIAATNHNLKQRIIEEKFRADLYYRISVGEICIPPLRERTQDIRDIALQMVQRINQSMPFSRILTNAALEALTKHEWKGNVRELDIVLKKALLLSSELIIGPEDIFPQEDYATHNQYSNEWEPGIGISQYIQNIRINAFEKALQMTNGNQSAAARLLQVPQQSVNKFVKDKNIETK